MASLQVEVIEEIARYRGSLLGLAVGDALGTTLEFQARGTFEPIDDIEGGGPFNLKPGEWTDDTSMALCLAESLIESRGFDALDQMQRYCRWKMKATWESNRYEARLRLQPKTATRVTTMKSVP